MSTYVKQDFQSGEVLKAEQLNYIEDAIKKNRETLDVVYQVGEQYNLFNRSSKNNVSGAFLHRNGTVYTVAGYIYSHPIPVSAGEIYHITVNPDLTADYVCCYYDANGGVITSSLPAKTSSGSYWKTTAPTNSVSMRINTDNNRAAAVMVVQSTTEPTGDYVPYVEARSGMVYNHDLDLEKIKNEDNLLFGKKLSLNGDSICAGAGATGGYGKIIGERCGMVVENVGVSGATITYGTYDGSTARHWICDTIADMDENADYVILEGGVNDASLGVEMGTYTPNSYTSSLDKNTFCGAFESMLKTALTHFTKAKIFYLAVHKMASKFNSNDSYNSYYHTAIALCRKWGIPVIDLNTQVPPLGMYVEDTDLIAMRNNYTKDGDGWHPNEAGYNRFYVDPIIAALKNGVAVSSTDDMPDEYHSSGTHNAVYRGKYLGSSVTDTQWEEIYKGTFRDLYIGDYWTISGVNYRIAAFDCYYNTGNAPCTKHHVTLVPDSYLYTHEMNDTATTTDGYANSKMRTEGLEQAKTIIKEAFGEDKILKHCQVLTNAAPVDSAAFGYSWYETEVELLTFDNVFGGIFDPQTDYNSGVGFTCNSFPLFVFDQSKRNIGSIWWLRDIGGTHGFYCIGQYGQLQYVYANTNTIAVRPSFSIYYPVAES